MSASLLLCFLSKSAVWLFISTPCLQSQVSLCPLDSYPQHICCPEVWKHFPSCVWSLCPLCEFQVCLDGLLPSYGFCLQVCAHGERPEMVAKYWAVAMVSIWVSLSPFKGVVGCGGQCDSQAWLCSLLCAERSQDCLGSQLRAGPLECPGWCALSMLPSWNGSLAGEL